MMKKRIWHKLICVFFICICIGLPKSNEIWAVPSAVYTFTPITKQVSNGNTPYFELSIASLHKEVFEIEIGNTTDYPLTVSTQSFTLEGKGKTKLSDIITGYRNITIPAQKSFLLQFTATIPSAGLSADVNGALAFVLAPGNSADSSTSQNEEQSDSNTTNLSSQKILSPEGIEFVSMEEEEAKQPEMVQTTISNVLLEQGAVDEEKAQEMYVVPVLLKAVKKEGKGDLFVKEVATDNHQEGLEVIIQNTAEQILKDVTIEAVVRKKGKKKVYYEILEEHVEIPANFDYKLKVRRKGELVDPGKYTMQIYLTGTSAKWDWTKDFLIEEDGEIQVQKRPLLLRLEWQYYLGAGGILGIVIVCVTIFQIMKGRRQNEEVLLLIKSIKHTIKKNI